MRLEFARRVDDRLLVVRPNAQQYGHLALEMLMALEQARSEGTGVCFLPAGRVVSPPLLDLESSDVRVVRPGAAARAWLRGRWWAASIPDVAGARRELVLETLYHETGRQLSRHIVEPDMPDDVRRRLRAWKVALADREQRRRGERGLPSPYFRRRLIVEPVPVALRPAVRERARALAATLGIAADARIVTIHSREPGFKRGMEVHEKHERLRKEQPRDDRTRNARIESYLPAVEYLAARGFTVVRIGDPSMTPLRHPAVIDLATSPQRTQALEVDCLLRSAFLISGEAGPVGVSYLTNTPVVNVNATDPVSSYPVRRTGICLFKRVFDVETGRELTAWDLLTSHYLTHVRDTTRFRYEDNTPAQIVAAVQEMLALLDGGTETAAQAAFRAKATEMADRVALEFSYVRKWGPDAGFLGHGRVAAAALEAAAQAGA